MSRFRTFSEAVFASDAVDPAMAVDWARAATTQILTWLWQAFEQMRQDYFHKVDFKTEKLEQLERDLAQSHFIGVQLLFHDAGGYASIIPMMERSEMERRSSAQAKPPANDFGFVHRTYRHWAWPVEAKVLRTAGDLSEYVRDIREKFETGIAGPHVGEGGMIGYLLSGSPNAVFRKLEDDYALKLEMTVESASYPHRASRHRRDTAPDLRLHHMMMVCQMSRSPTVGRASLGTLRRKFHSK